MPAGGHESAQTYLMPFGASALGLLRKLIWRLPERLQPKVEPEIWVVAFDPDNGAVVGGIRTRHPDFGVVTGVVESGGRLWMGTIAFPAVAYANVPSRPESVEYNRS